MMSDKQPWCEKHTWVICAYGESPYLRTCIRSLVRQRVRSGILIATSTPNEHIASLAGEFGIEVRVNPGPHGITNDWNYAVGQVETEYVTIAHQDDVYDSHYLEYALKAVEKAEKPLIFFSDYYEIRAGERVSANKNLMIKRVMLAPFRFRALWSSKWVRRRILSLGSPIDCPSVMYVKPNLPKVLFDPAYSVTQDWDAWERFSKLDGEFVFDPHLLMGHRIHEESTTTELIADKTRTKEELSIYRRFWPEGVARWIERRYEAGQKSNEV